MNPTATQLMVVTLADRRTSDLDTQCPDLRAELERHHAACVGWARSCCGWNLAEADDVLQSSYLKVLDGRARFHARSAFKTWLFAVIRKTASEHRRRHVLRQLLPDKLRWPYDDDVRDDPLVALGRSESSTELLRALSRLPRRQRELLHLVFYQELRIEDAAEVLGISVGTARTHYERGKARLRQLLTAGA
jgi:RNA polymerase sigma-70 factor (ECF subfamily)